MATPHENEFDANADGDLHWLAFRYAVGELSGDEEADFERQLTDAQSAREALEQVVELNAAMRTAVDSLETTSPISPSVRVETATPSSAGSNWMAWTLAAVAGVALTVGLVWLSQQSVRQAVDGDSERAVDNAPNVERPSDAEADPASLAAAWADLRSRTVSDPVELDARWNVDAEADTVPMDAERDDGGALPDWLLTAVASENQGDR